MATQRIWQGPAEYRIKTGGRLGNQWTKWFEGFSVVSEGEITIFTGRVVDQSALHGLLVKIRDLGIPIISIRRLDSDSDHNHKMKR